MGTPKFQNGIGLAYLSCPLKYKRFPIFIFFPSFQIIYNLSIHKTVLPKGTVFSISDYHVKYQCFYAKNRIDLHVYFYNFNINLHIYCMLFRYSFAETPAIFLKTREKWAISRNPTSSATSPILSAGFFSSSLAASTRTEFRSSEKL